MKIFVYNYREFDEKNAFLRYSSEMGFTWDSTTDYPDSGNIAQLAGKGYDAISVISCPITADIVEQLHELGIRHIATRSLGYDHIDLTACKKYGITVSHAVYPPDSVASYTVMLMLMSLRKIPEIFRRNVAQDYTLSGKLGREISAYTVGIIGTGKIGSAVARRLRGFGCRILATDSYINQELTEFVEYTDLETLLSTADVVTLHVPAMAENYHLITRERLQLMKHDAILINTARGDLIDTEALIDALQNGVIGGAALDVIEDETELYYQNCSGTVLSRTDFYLLRTLPNVILTPHTAFYTVQATSEMVRTTFTGWYEAVEGKENPLYVVPFPDED